METMGVNMTIVSYTTVLGVDQKKFVESIVKQIEKGFVPLGGISVTASGSELIQAQAMVNYAE